MKILQIKSKSLAESLGLKPGDILRKINGRRVIDEIDYKFRITEQRVLLEFEINGKFAQFDIEKDYDDDLGVNFEDMKIRSCANDCVFCFVDQNPPNMRDGLYFRDGDYRLSYLYGHYITMTNMGPKQLKRIVEQKLSPLYVSVHVTNPILRKKLFLYNSNDKLLDKIKYLTKNGITLHTQIVLMPTINDNEYLFETISDLYKYHPSIKTCSIVPVGLTKHRKGLMYIPNVTKEYAESIILLKEKFEIQFPGKSNRFVLLSDEWFILARKLFPPLQYYGSSDLTENGVGMVPKFLCNFNKIKKHFPKQIKNPKHITIATGKLIEKIFKKDIIPILKKIKNLEITYYAINNNFYGDSVTVSGLLTGEDIITQLKNKKLGDSIWMTNRILDDGKNKTLDNFTLEKISRELNCKFNTTDDNFSDIISYIKL